MSQRGLAAGCVLAGLIAFAACAADDQGADKAPPIQAAPIGSGGAAGAALAGQGAPAGALAGSTAAPSMTPATGAAGAAGAAPPPAAGLDAAVPIDAGASTMLDAATPAVDAAKDAGVVDSAAPAPAADSGSAPDAGAPGDGAGGRGQDAPFAPVYRIALRVHRGDSSLDEKTLLAVLDEMNWIWWSQAAICFEIEIVDGEQTMQDGFDFWFHKSEIPCSPGANGVYCGDHDIHTLDKPSLGPADNAEWDTQHDPSRTSAHELGHGLSLEHYNGYADSNDSLMSSGRQGFKLHDSEIDAARTRARSKGLTDTAPLYCGAPKITP